MELLDATMGLAFLVAELAGVGFAQERTPTRSHLAFEVSPILDLHAHVRVLAQSGAETPEALKAAVTAARELGVALGPNPLAWGPIEGQTVGCLTGEQLVLAFEALPEVLEIPGRSVPLRAAALDLARALREAEADFLATLWPEHRSRIDAARTRLEEVFVPHEAECLAHHLERLGMSDPGLVIRVTLTAEGPFPGAATYLGPDGKGVCFVSVDGTEGSLLFETVLHEATHALDVAVGDESSFGFLRTRLAEAGLEPRDPMVRNLPHALMFVQSADSIRHSLVPRHRDYGEVAGLYARLAPASEIALGAWNDFLEGRRTRDEALQDMVDEALERAH